MDHTSELQKFLPLAIFSASLLGSVHCAAMCGGLAMSFSKNNFTRLAYHLGRGVAYTSLGALSGYFGKTFFESEALKPFRT